MLDTRTAPLLPDRTGPAIDAGQPEGALRAPGLTRRETAVLRVLVQGRCDKEIAQALGISVRTVRFHLSAIFRKYEVATRTELIVKANHSGGGAQEASA